MTENDVWNYIEQVGKGEEIDRFPVENGGVHDV